MGTIDAALSKLGRSEYEARFRFSAELAKGLAVGESFLWVTEFSGGPMSRTVLLGTRSTDQSILLTVTAVRQFKFLRVVLGLSEGLDSAISALQDLRIRRIPIFASLGIQRKVFGKRAELYILRDHAAKILDVEPTYGWGGTTWYKVRLELSSPELHHGVGEGFNLKKV